MSWLDALRHRWHTLAHRDRLGRALEDEMRFHLEQDARHEGRTVADARRQFGNLGVLTDERRRASGLAGLDRLLQDARYAGRQLVRAPGFTIAVSLTLAFGIGANATLFAIIDRIMLRAPEGLAAPERVAELRSWSAIRDGRRDSSFAFAYPSFVEIRAMRDLFVRVTAVRGPIDVPVDRGADASSARGALVGDDYFQTLGVHAAIGRVFAAGETNESAGAPVVVLAHDYWQRRYGGDRRVLGQTLLANNIRYTIIGVAPRGFVGHTLDATDFWLPIAATPGLRMGREDWATARGNHWLTVIVRLREDVPPEQVVAALAVRWSAWNLHPERATTRRPTPYLVSMVPGENRARPEHRVARLLSGVALLLLAITCANVANLLLARALARRREIAIRLALGVGRGRLTTLFVIDAVLLSLLGGAAALAVAWLGIPVVRAVLFAGTRTGQWTVDARVVAFTMLTALVAGGIAGIVPALQASRPSLIGALRQGSREGVVHRSRTRLALLVFQGALSVSLLAGTGLFVRSLRQIGAQHLGLDLGRVIVVDFDLHRSGFPPSSARPVYDAMRSRALAMPGVDGASFSIGVPFEGQYALPLRIPGQDSIPGMPRGHAPFLYAVTPDFFRTMGTRLVAGRSFTDADMQAGAPAVAVVNVRMARQIWPRIDAIGQCFKIELRLPTPDCVQVIGIVEDVRRDAMLEAEPSPQYYLPLGRQPANMDELTLLVRAADPARIRAALGMAVQAIRNDMPFVHLRTLEEVVAPELRPWRLGASVFALLGVLALVVATVGTFSVMQFSVAQRRHELGVRVALGARRGHLVRMVSGESLRIGAVAAATGVVVVLAAGGLVEGLLFQTSPRDPVVLASVAGVLMLSGILAALAPAWRATRVDPAATLRTD